MRAQTMLVTASATAIRAPAAGLDESLDRLLADADRRAALAEMALSDHRNVANRQLQGAAALLPGDQPRDAAVDLVDEVSLGPDRGQPENQAESLRDRQIGRNHKRRPCLRDVLQLETTSGECCSESERAPDPPGSVSSRRVVNHDATVARDFAQHLAGHLLARADRAQLRQPSGLHQQGGALLVLGAPDLQNGHRLVADRDVADLDPPADRLDQLGQDVAGSAGALVVDADDRVVRRPSRRRRG